MFLSVGQEDAKKRKFFRSKGNHVYGAKGWVLSLALQKRSRENRDDFADMARFVLRNATVVVNLVFIILGFSFSSIAFFFHSPRLISVVYFFFV